jgi:hypothetical protein
MPERVADAYHALIREREGELELIRKHREIRSHALDMSAPYPGWVDFLLDYIDNHYGYSGMSTLGHLDARGLIPPAPADKE